LATWQEVSRECLQAAKRLVGDQYLRSSINRSYYAAYCAVTSELTVRGVTFAHGWNNPAHEQVPDLILHNTTLPLNTRRRLRKLLRVLREAREDADYRPGITIDRTLALNCVRDAIAVLHYLEIEHDGTE
jgi:uncharacterized protein (UPF0332 family)